MLVSEAKKIKFKSKIFKSLNLLEYDKYRLEEPLKVKSTATKLVEDRLRNLVTHIGDDYVVRKLSWVQSMPGGPIQEEKKIML